MFRKTIVAVVATAAIAAAALPTSASAHHIRWGWGLGGLGVGFAAGALYANSIAPVCRVYYQTRVNRWGRIYTVPVTYC